VSHFQVFATRWDDGHVIEEVVPAKGISFSLPLSDHGEASFSATVGPGRNDWRQALSCATSGILICQDNVPVWAGQMTGESQSGPRTFDFKAQEYGAFFKDVPANSSSVPTVYSGWNDHAIFRDLVTTAQSKLGQDVGVLVGSTLGAYVSDLTVDFWGTTSCEEEFRRLGEAEGGPDWYFAATGTLENPTRTLVLGDRLGSVAPVAVLEYVEDSGEGERGGNVIAHPGRQQSPGLTATWAIGSGDRMARKRYPAVAMDLIIAGHPRRTRTVQYQDVVNLSTLGRHANADLAAARGMTTAYSLSTFGDRPTWVSIARGDTVTVSLDTDAYGGGRPVVFNTRVLEIRVKGRDEGPPVVDYLVADVRVI